MSVLEQASGRIAGPNEAQFVVTGICSTEPEVQAVAAQYLKDHEVVVWVDLSTRRIRSCGHIGYTVPMDVTNEARSRAGLKPYKFPAFVCESMGQLIE